MQHFDRLIIKRKKHNHPKHLFIILGLIFIIPPSLTLFLLILDMLGLRIGGLVKASFSMVPELLLIIVWIILPLCALAYWISSCLRKKPFHKTQSQ
ncbi:MAG: hypothetical protein HYY51_03010 [Candidatus Magasanikbacteria bacterium]|nr:hypothetical protein [Candidatus Magasanikbacteria bacterium]